MVSVEIKPVVGDNGGLAGSIPEKTASAHKATPTTSSKIVDKGANAKRNSRLTSNLAQ